MNLTVNVKNTRLENLRFLRGKIALVRRKICLNGAGNFILRKLNKLQLEHAKNTSFKETLSQ